MAKDSDFGAFLEKFTINPDDVSSSQQLPLSGLTFAIKDIFDVEGRVSGFGNPDWRKTHSAAKETSPIVVSLVKAGANLIGKTVMDEMAYSINGENIHYGTPTNPCAPDRVPGGSSSGSAVAVAANLVDFSLGTDTGGSIRVPASYCGIFGFRPSHGSISTSGVIPMAQSFDTVGWFARDPMILRQVGKILLEIPDTDPVITPTKVYFPEDCFKILSFAGNYLTSVLVKSLENLYGSSAIEYVHLGDYIENNVPSLKHYMNDGTRHGHGHDNIPSLAALSTAMRTLQRYEFKKNHSEWVKTVKPKLGPGLSERIWEAIESTDENIDLCYSVQAELTAALTALLEENGILALPTVPGPPPKLEAEASSLEIFRAKAFSLLSVAGVSGFCQVSIPLGMYENLPISVSLMAKHSSDSLLLNILETVHHSLKQHSKNHSSHEDETTLGKL